MWVQICLNGTHIHICMYCVFLSGGMFAVQYEIFGFWLSFYSWNLQGALSAGVPASYAYNVLVSHCVDWERPQIHTTINQICSQYFSHAPHKSNTTGFERAAQKASTTPTKFYIGAMVRGKYETPHTNPFIINIIEDIELTFIVFTYFA